MEEWAPCSMPFVDAEAAVSHADRSQARTGTCARCATGHENGLRNVEVCRMTTDWLRYDEAEQTLVVRSWR